jgi:probable rRNA maturation factor
LLGDVVISLDAARAEAEQAGIPWRERLLSLLIHGILHLIGYDHMGDEEKAQQMAGEEGRILGMLKEKMPGIGLTTKGFSH